MKIVKSSGGLDMYYWFCCPNCGNIFNGTGGYCPKCDYPSTNTITSNASTAAIENYIKTQLPNAANANRGFYGVECKDSNFLQLPKYDKLTINTKSIIINDDKISITIDKDNIGKFNVIEINGVKFVKEDD